MTALGANLEIVVELLFVDQLTTLAALHPQIVWDLSAVLIIGCSKPFSAEAKELFHCLLRFLLARMRASAGDLIHIRVLALYYNMGRKVVKELERKRRKDHANLHCRRLIGSRINGHVAD